MTFLNGKLTVLGKIAHVLQQINDSIYLMLKIQMEMKIFHS